MQWGDKLEFLEKIAATGEEVPALINRPIPTIYQKQFWEAFNLLSNSRRFHSVGISFIPISEIKSYLELYNINDIDLRNLYIIHLKAMDDVYVSHYAKKS